MSSDAMADERIPEAVLGAAPGLEIKHGNERPAAPSESVQSKFSVAMTAISKKGLVGVPIAEKVFHPGTKKPHWRFCDSSGNEITKKEVEQMGFAWYQDPVDPAKGRLRNPHSGKFVGEEHARTIIEGSRAGSDIAYLPDVEELPGIKEEADRAQWFGFAARVVIMAAIVLFGAQQLSGWSRSLVQQDTTAVSSVNPELSWLLAEAEKLAKTVETRSSKGNEPTREQGKAMAATEIERILASGNRRDILGMGTPREQLHEFHRIVLLLHPDKGLVSSDDPRASLALRLAFAARPSVSLKD